MPQRKTPETYLESFDAFPPNVCWILARKLDRKPVTQAEIAFLTGWGLNKVRKVCALKSFATLSVKDADAFRRATGVTRSSERRQRWYLKTTLNLSATASGLQHFRKHPGSAMVKAVALSTAP